MYDEGGNPADKMTAAKALYVPEENKNFTAYLTGSVNIETRDALKVRTEQVVYTRANDTAEAADQVEFERENMRGKSFGALVHNRREEDRAPEGCRDRYL
jgi:lipopolysaccharide assembly outer membrane protein LptD (OstA)